MKNREKKLRVNVITSFNEAPYQRIFNIEILNSVYEDEEQFLRKILLHTDKNRTLRKISTCVSGMTYKELPEYIRENNGKWIFN